MAHPRIRPTTLACLAVLAAGPLATAQSPLKKVLVYDKAGWYVHPDIPKINEHLKKMGADNGFAVDVSSNPADFNATKLAGYQVVVLNNISEMGTSVKEAAQRNALIAWIEGGGGLVGFHGSGVVRDTWPWFIQLLGTDWYYDAAMQEARVFVPENVRSLAIVSGGATEARLSDEWNNFKVNVDTLQGIDVVLSVDEASYDPTRKKNPSEGNNVPGFRMADPQGRWTHPVSWIRTQGKGKVFYSCIGHDINVVSHAFTTRHFLRAIQWAGGALESATGVEGFYARTLGSDPGFELRGAELRLRGNGAYSLEIFSHRGERRFAASGKGPSAYDLKRILGPGIYGVRVHRQGAAPGRGRVAVH